MPSTVSTFPTEKRAAEVNGARTIASEEGCDFEHALWLYKYRNCKFGFGPGLGDHQLDWCEGYEKARGKNEADRIFNQFSRPGEPRSSSPRQEPVGPLQYIELDGDLMPRPWLIQDRIPRRNVTLLSGIGSIGNPPVIAFASQGDIN